MTSRYVEAKKTCAIVSLHVKRGVEIHVRTKDVTRGVKVNNTTIVVIDFRPFPTMA